MEVLRGHTNHESREMDYLVDHGDEGASAFDAEWILRWGRAIVRFDLEAMGNAAELEF